MGEEVLPSYLRSKLSSILDEAEADDGGSPTHIISRLRSIQTRIESMFANSWPMMVIIPVDLLYELIGLVSECRVFSFERRTAAVSKKGFGFYFPKLLSELMFNRRMRRRLDIIERKIEDRTTVQEPPQPPAPIIEETYPIKYPWLIIGFEAQAEKMEAWLMRKQEEEAPLRVVGIVGRCGCGKTALAQKVFGSPIVKKEFSPMIWVSLSNMLLDDDRKVRVVNYILKEIGRHDDRGVSNSDHSSLDRLAEELQGKRYLIVLDNAWRLDEWYEELFSHGLPGGGAVIVTSRREDVIRRMVGDDKHVIWVQPHLSDEICCQIFSQVLQQRGEMYLINHPQLSSIEDDVKRNFDGLPLAAKTLANILPDLLTTYWVRARDLYIENGDDASCWRWSSLPPPQEMEEVAELVAQVPYIYIQASVELKELVMKSSYSAYLVFKLKTKDHPGLNWEAAAQVRIVDERNRGVQFDEVRRVFMESEGMQRKGEEEQGWMEINLGLHSFTSNYLGGDHGRLVEAKFFDGITRDAYLKSGLVVKGIEFRAH